MDRGPTSPGVLLHHAHARDQPLESDSPLVAENQGSLSGAVHDGDKTSLLNPSIERSESVKKQETWRQELYRWGRILVKYSHWGYITAGPMCAAVLLAVAPAVSDRDGLVMLAVTSILPLAIFPLFGIMEADEVAPSYLNDTIVLFLGSFIFALAVEKWNIHRRIALKMLLIVGREGMDPRLLLLGFCIGPAFLSMWISNTATAIMMVPMAVGVLDKVMAVPVPYTGSALARQLSSKATATSEAAVLNTETSTPSSHENGYDKGSKPATVTPMDVELGAHELVDKGNEAEALRSYCKGVVLAVAYAASIGGMATLTGTGPNLVLAGVWQKTFPRAPPITFMQWLAFGFPLAFVFIFILWLLLCVWHCPQSAVPIISTSLNRSLILDEYDRLGPASFAERAVLVDFGVLALLWMTRSFTGDIPGWGALFHNRVGDGTVSVALATLLFVLPSKRAIGERLLTWEDCHRLPWDIVLLLGGGFALSKGVAESGLAEDIGERLHVLEHLPTVLLTLVVVLCVCFTTEFSSNSATATVFLPLLAHVAISIHRHPLVLMVPATIACSYAFMLPVATPPNAIAYSTGYFTMREMAVPGFILNCVGTALLTIFMPTLGTLFFDTAKPFSQLMWLKDADDTYPTPYGPPAAPGPAT
eukprot:SM000185S04039  [mRNA]  locus=s185:125856:130483:+ [translate_table: standard]